jgi:large subunit ribosomal protein L4
MAEEKVKKAKTTVKVEKKPVTASPVTPKTAKTSEMGLTVDVYGVDGKVSGSIELPEVVFGAKVNKQLIAQAVRVYLANQREGSASTKSRGEVTGSSRKIYRQKGTGRARHGGIRAPIFVHGGIAHGPKPRDFSLKMPQKMRRAALYATLALKAKSGSVKVIDGLDTLEPKTKMMVTLLAQIAPEAKNKKVLFVLGDKQDNIIRAARNIEGLTYDYARQLHAYEVMNNQTVIFVKQALETFTAPSAAVSAGKKEDK